MSTTIKPKVHDEAGDQHHIEPAKFDSYGSFISNLSIDADRFIEEYHADDLPYLLPIQCTPLDISPVDESAEPVKEVPKKIKPPVSRKRRKKEQNEAVRRILERLREESEKVPEKFKVPTKPATKRKHDLTIGVRGSKR